MSSKDYNLGVEDNFQEIPTGATKKSFKSSVADFLFSPETRSIISKDKMNNHVSYFMNKHRGLLPEMQCFVSVKIHSHIQDIKDSGAISFVPKTLDLMSWTSLGMPQPSIQFKADPSTMYRPVFGGISSQNRITIGYQDFSNLYVSSALWNFYASQFHEQGYLIKGAKLAGTGELISTTVSYTFHAYYNSDLKSVYKQSQGDVIIANSAPKSSEETTKSQILWNIQFFGVVLEEPQVAGLSPTMGTLSRSMSFLYDRYTINFPDTLKDK